ncbi:hypothetical protein [Dongia deserti]|uniref:hypothetical protein n=1 Tax=Dongia deserti TaxID=2268030 RepID=UPI000E64A797|nr:hypothetical protein [Dongia deserti]
MLYYVTRELHSYTIDDFLACFRRCGLVAPDFVRPISYEALFANKCAPIGNYVFSDLDRLSGYEIDAATEIAKAIASVPGAVVVNWPNRVLGRYALLRRLYENGVNSYDVWRLDEHRMPTAYPVFIRREQDALGPESPLLKDESEYRAAVDALQSSGRGLAGRIAVQFRHQADNDGIYRKYGAFCFRGQIVPQHLFLSRDWVVKRSSIDLTQAMIEEEEQYVFGNPHAEQLGAIFKLAEIDFGRADYAVVDGRIEIFEINTNPTFPRVRRDRPERARRRHHAVEGVVAGFRSFDQPIAKSGFTRFRTPKPKLHRLRDRSLRRRMSDLASGIRWRLAGLIHF